MNWEKILNDPNYTYWVQLTKHNYYSTYYEWFADNDLDEKLVKQYDKTNRKWYTDGTIEGVVLKVIKAAPHSKGYKGKENLLILGITDKDSILLVNFTDTKIFRRCSKCI